MNDSGDGLGFVALLLFASGPAAGWFTWAWIQKRYRNRDARYRPDRSVAHTVSSLTGNDQPRGRFRSRSSSIDGRNDHAPDQRAARAQFYHGELHTPEPPRLDDEGEREGEAEPPPPPPGG